MTFNPSTPTSATDTDITLSNARRFYLSMGNPAGVKRLSQMKKQRPDKVRSKLIKA